MNTFKTLLAIIIICITQPAFAQTDTTIRLKVEGECGMCKTRIEKSIKIKGISAARWDLKTKTLTVTYDPALLKAEDIHSKMAEIGHDTELKKANDEVYKALPECCLYRGGTKTEEDHIEDGNVNGVVLSEDKKGNFLPLSGASILWLGTSKGTVTNIHGSFSIPPVEGITKLLISYTGFRQDTIETSGNNELQIVLAPNGQLANVTVKSRQRRSTFVNTQSAVRTMNITSKELLKAACCNLSESFETNPSVDVSYSDAVTGAKQIQLLGLSGNYTQLTIENLPGPRGIATPLGLNSVAGPWIESMQLSKGTGSVVNGFESIAGQINVELKKPENSERLFANGYVNNMGRTDINLNLTKQLDDNWSSALLLHDNFQYTKADQNHDGFRDLPTGNQFSLVNRWNYQSTSGLESQFGIKLLTDRRVGGEVDFTEDHKLTTQHYGLGINTDRYEAFAKIGYLFPGKKFRSIGLQLSAFDHKQDSYFGLTTYNARQKNFYSNLIFQDIIGTTDHKYRAGISFIADTYNEQYKTQNFKRNEIVPGAFFEYTYTMNEKFNLIAGIRADHNNLFGWFATPRLHVRYEPVSGTTIRLSAGRGQRTANIFAENMGTMVSARNISIVNASAGKAYGLDPEIAWNKGITIDQKLKLFGREASFAIDFFRNDFTNQVVVDLETPHFLKFYNLQGKSYSNSLQAELNTTPVKNLDVRLAYRWFDVKQTYNNVLLQKPFTAAHRAFANLGYEISGWKFDYTVNYIGNKRVPVTINSPGHPAFPTTSPDYVTMNAQVSKELGKNKNLELYLGGENLTNYMQEHAILSPDQPFSQHFDAAMIWGPVSGRLIYAGFRFKIK